jgi:hypothetical protein
VIWALAVDSQPSFGGDADITEPRGSRRFGARGFLRVSAVSRIADRTIHGQPTSLVSLSTGWITGRSPVMSGVRIALNARVPDV